MGSLHGSAGWLVVAFFGGLQSCYGQGVPRSVSLHRDKWNELVEVQNLDQCLKHFEGAVKADPKDEAARCLLGITRVLRAVEDLGQAWYRFGVREQFFLQSVPFFRLPIPPNPDSELVTYEKVRSTIEAFADEIRTAQSELVQPLGPGFKLHLKLGKVRLDWDDNGNREDGESFQSTLRKLSPAALQLMGEEVEVGIDHADIAWLRGYCHVLLALNEVVLAHDQRELFERCGHLFFAKIDSPFLLTQNVPVENDFNVAFISDLIASIHLFRFPCREPDRMRKAHEHLLAMVEDSRWFWRLAMQETDNDREWIPNPSQTGVLQVPVNRDLVVGWLAVLDEVEAILKGEKLVPYWRVYSAGLGGAGPLIPDEGSGINVRRFFYEPREFDLVLAVQGSAWEVYLEDGPLSTPRAWEQLTRVFGGRFFGFAAWVN